MRRGLFFAVLALFAVGCSARPIGGETGWKIYGPTGAQGLAGPAGPAGPQGPQGIAGPSGAGSAQGMAGPAGPAGPQGPQGPQGSGGAQGVAGAIGAQGAAAPVASWTKFNDILFDFDKSDIRTNETTKVADIAAYVQKNPTAMVGLDGYADPRGTDTYNQALSERRVNTIRDALTSAGVGRDKIQTGAFGEMRLKCQEATETCWQSDRRVEVLIGAAK
jgi:outer membrane protein OmpA-like peptidoglycan-associated protein